MKRLTAHWTTALATAALIALPVAGSAQTPQTQPEPQPEQSTTLSTPSAQNQNPTEADSPAEHLRQAKAALANVDANNVPAGAKSQLAALKRHINSLERSAGMNDSASTTGAAQRSSKATKARGSESWANDVAAIDRIITELAGSGSAAMTGTGNVGTAGTSGVGTTAKSGKSGAMTLDETSRSQLLEVRSHITAFAAAMSGTAASPSSSSPGTTAGAANSASAHGSAATGHAGAATTGQTGSATGEAVQAGQTGSTAGQSSSATTGTAGQTEPQTGSATSTTGQTGSTTGTAGEPGQPGQADVQSNPNTDPEAAKQHLTAARDSLTQLTQLPAAAQLQGDARTQVSQLIQNFNELITTQENWRASYDKVEANLTALIGPAQETTDAATPSSTPQAAPAPAPTTTNPPSDPAAPAQGTQGAPGTPGTPQSGTEGAVGTSGTVSTAATLDPGIRQKLVDFRNHLKAFRTAAGGDAK